MIIFRIKELRKQKKISLNNLSIKTNISRAYLYDLENNRRTNPTLRVLINIANVLNVNIKSLFYTDFDIENLKQEMYTKIEQFGLGSSEVLEISQVIDLLINIDFKEKKKQ